MFDQSLSYKLVQIRKNRHPLRESFLHEYIYKFYRHNSRSCIKYIVSVKTYSEELMTLDYYPKIDLTPKQNSTDNIQDLRYRLMTRQNSFGYIGGTILDIMVDMELRTSTKTWGFLAANLVTETTNENNKRYQIYKEILRRTFVNHFQVLGNKENSAIFVIPDSRIADVELIIEYYGQIFAETN
jgi:hypothetical protein